MILKFNIKLVLLILLGSTNLFAQNPFPYGISLDSIILDNNSNAHTQTFHCFKPTTYNPLTSPLIIAIHGVGGNGMIAIGDLDSIAERRQALIIAPNYALSGFTGIMRHEEPVWVYVDTISACVVLRPATEVITSIYKHVLGRENLNSLNTYMIGFSAGAQFVSRYLLIRQAYPDSIPLKMSVSSNAYFYTFPTDTFNGTAMLWPCGLIMPTLTPAYCPQNMYGWNCQEHIVQYYNENYGVLIGTGDVSPQGGTCAMAQGNNRYERALNFYNFADSNAINHGTLLNWQYKEIIGIGHDQHAMYNTKEFATDTSSIAEKLLFETTSNPITFSAPVANFVADTTIVQLFNTVNFTNNSINAINYLWNFGDGNTSQQVNPSHTYTSTGYFSVHLTAYNSTGCDNWAMRRNYIKVIDPVSVFENSSINLEVFPNPVSDYLSINLDQFNDSGEIEVFDLIGKLIINQNLFKRNTINVSALNQSLYFYEITLQGTNKKYFGKFFKY